MRKFTITPKKKLIALLALLFLVGLPSLLSFFATQNQTTQQPNQSNTQQDPMASRITVVPTYEAVVAPRWKTFNGNGFTFQYPPEWQVQANQVAGGGQMIMVRPEALPAEMVYPQFIIQTQPAGIDALEKKAGFLEGLTLKRSETTISDLPAIKYTGSIPFKTSGGRTVQEPIQDTTYLLKHKNTLYVIKYEYEESSPNNDLETYFGDFVSSFKINP